MLKRTDQKKQCKIIFAVMLLTFIFGCHTPTTTRRQVSLPDPVEFARNSAEAARILADFDNPSLEQTEEVEIDVESDVNKETVTTKEAVSDMAIEEPSEFIIPCISVSPCSSPMQLSKSITRCYRSTFKTGNRFPQYPETKWQQNRYSPLSTVSFNVDTASFTYCRRTLENGTFPFRAAIRVEDFVNYFNYSYPPPKSDETFSLTSELGPCPWNSQNKLLLLGFKAKSYQLAKEPVSNLVFLIDVSGSMFDNEKLPLLKRCLSLLINRLNPNDKLSIITYANSTKVLIDGATINEKSKLLAIIDTLEAKGSTNGADALQQAYTIARKHLITTGNNRVILATDGDFNVGPSSDSKICELVTQQRKSNIFLTILGLGDGNLNDSMMKKMADCGNGNYYYIDTFTEAIRLFTNKLTQALHVVAKDAKIQLEFNPEYVSKHKLLGYNSRILEAHQFQNNKQDAGDVGAGQCVTFLYELTLTSPKSSQQAQPTLRYQTNTLSKQAQTDEFVKININYKEPTASTSQTHTQYLFYSKLKTKPLTDNYLQASTAAALALTLSKKTKNREFNFTNILEFLELHRTNHLSEQLLSLLDLYETASLIMKNEE